MSTDTPCNCGRAGAALLCATLMYSGVLGAQPPVTPPMVPNTLRGIVTDTLGAPLADVLVLVSELRRQVRTQSMDDFSSTASRRARTTCARVVLATLPPPSASRSRRKAAACTFA